MKILMINYEFPPVGGGGGVASKKIAKGFVDLGHDVDFITSFYPGLKKNEIVEGINVHRVKVIGREDMNTASMISMLSFPLSGFQKSAKLCKKNDYDFINTHFAVPSGPLGILLSKIFRIDHILTIIGGDIYDPSKDTSPHNKGMLNKAVEKVINSSEVVVSESSDIKQNAKRYYDVDNEIHVIPYPYENFPFQNIKRKKLDLDKDVFYLISIGRLVKRKGYKYLIQALSLLERDDVELLILGDGPEKENLENLAEELGISERVHLLGYIDGERKFQYLDNADLYVLSSLHEGFGIVLQEAMQVGLPIVATNHGGQTDFIEEGENGYLVPPKDAKELADKISILIEDEKKREKFGRKNEKKIETFDTKKICKRYLDLLDSIKS